MSGSIYPKSEENYFIPNGNQQSWYTADKLCHEQNGHLVKISDTEAKISAQLYILERQNESENIEGFWVGIQPESNNLCHVLDKFGLVSNVSCSDTVNVQSGKFYLGLCQKQSTDLYTSEILYYTCQCPENYGYENCTYTDQIEGSIQFGYTYCVKTPDEVELKSASDSLPLIFIDHAAYGKPLSTPYETSGCTVGTTDDTEEVSLFLRVAQP